MRRFAIVVAAALGAASWVACVGSDPATGGSGGPATGDRLGACFPDGKCKEGLECRLPERICLTPGEPVPADAGIDASGGGSDGGTPDGAADASAADGGGGDCTQSPQADGPGPFCDGVKCGTGEGCCHTTTGKLQCQPQNMCFANGGTQFFACDGPGACGGGGTNCCLTATGAPTTGTQCGQKLVASTTACGTATCEPQSKFTLCKTTADCNGFGTCIPVEVELRPNEIVHWGVCLK